MIASDRKIGGFSGQWGADREAPRRKRARLEAEGVLFEGDRVAASCVLTTLEGTKRAAEPAKAPAKRRRGEPASPPAAASAAADGPTAAELGDCVLEILASRDPGKTC